MDSKKDVKNVKKATQQESLTIQRSDTDDSEVSLNPLDDTTSNNLQYVTASVSDSLQERPEAPNLCQDIACDTAIAGLNAATGINISMIGSAYNIVKEVAGKAEERAKQEPNITLSNTLTDTATAAAKEMASSSASSQFISAIKGVGALASGTKAGVASAIIGGGVILTESAFASLKETASAVVDDNVEDVKNSLSLRSQSDEDTASKGSPNSLIKGESDSPNSQSQEQTHVKRLAQRRSQSNNESKEQGDKTPPKNTPKRSRFL